MSDTDKHERVCSVCKKTFLSEYSKEREEKVACPPCLTEALRKYGWIK